MTKIKTSISLEKLEFHSYHGLYEQEKIEGNTYWVDVKVDLFLNPENEIQLNETADYEIIFETVKKFMNIPTELIENVCLNIIKELKNKFINSDKITVSIFKKSPPIGHKSDFSKCTMEL